MTIMSAKKVSILLNCHWFHKTCFIGQTIWRFTCIYKSKHITLMFFDSHRWSAKCLAYQPIEETAAVCFSHEWRASRLLATSFVKRDRQAIWKNEGNSYKWMNFYTHSVTISMLHFRFSFHSPLCTDIHT